MISTENQKEMLKPKALMAEKTSNLQNLGDPVSEAELLLEPIRCR